MQSDVAKVATRLAAAPHGGYLHAQQRHAGRGLHVWGGRGREGWVARGLSAFRSN